MNCLSVLWFIGVGFSLLFYYIPKERQQSTNSIRILLSLIFIFTLLSAGRLLSIKIDQGSVAPDEVQFSVFCGLLFSLAFLSLWNSQVQ